MDATIRGLPACFYLPRLSAVLALTVLLLPIFGRSATNNRQETCPPSVGNYTSRDPFSTSLNLLFSSLSTNTPATGFFNTSKGDAANQAYGLALCRGDLVLPSDCKPCVETAIRDLPLVCAGKRSSTIWYDDCLVRYSDENFFGVPTGSPHLTLSSAETAPDTISFRDAARALVESVARRAAATDPSASSISLYAVGNAARGNSGELYAMAQCTRDLSGDDCYTCLKDEIRYMRTYATAYIGMRTLGSSCLVRYESAPFSTVSQIQGGAPAPPMTVPRDVNTSATSVVSQGRQVDLLGRIGAIADLHI